MATKVVSAFTRNLLVHGDARFHGPIMMTPECLLSNCVILCPREDLIMYNVQRVFGKSL